MPIAALLALLACPAPATDQEPPVPTERQEPEPDQPAPSREHRALRALIELERDFLEEEPRGTREEVQGHFEAAHRAFGEFATSWKGSAASFKARMNQASLDHHFLGRTEEGISSLEAVYREMRARGGSYPKAASLSVAGVGLLLGQRMVETGQVERAIEVFGEVAELPVAEAATARRMAERARGLAALQPGQPVPAFTLADWDGTDRAPAEFEGRVLVIDFWASWARPCAEIQEVLRSWKISHPEDLAVLGVCFDPADQEDRARSTAARRGLDWPQIRPENGLRSALAGQFQVRRVPANVLVGRDGKIVARDLRPDQLRAMLLNLLADDSEDSDEQGGTSSH